MIADTVGFVETRHTYAQTNRIPFEQTILIKRSFQKHNHPGQIGSAIELEVLITKKHSCKTHNCF